MSAPINNEAFRNLLFSWPEKAISYLHERYYEDLLRTADAYTRNRKLSEDAVQEVMIDIFRKHKTLGQQHSQPFLAYLFRSVANQAITLYKKNLRAHMRESQYFYDFSRTSPEANAEARIISTERQAFLRVVLGTLTPKERECLLMQVEENLPVKEIAKRLGISAKAVERSLTSARKRLKKFRSNL